MMNSCYYISRLRQNTIGREATKYLYPSNQKSNSSYGLSSTILIPNRYFGSTIETNQVSNPKQFSHSNSEYESSTILRTNNDYFAQSALFGKSKIYQVNSYAPSPSYSQNRSFSSSIRCNNVTRDEVIQRASQSAETLNDYLVIPTTNAPVPSLDLTENVLSSSNIEEFASVVEPSLRSLGLAHWWPSGFMQSFLESIHLNMDVSWSGTIILTTVLLRVCIFPLVIRSKKVMVKSNHNLPESQRLQVIMQSATKKSEQIKALNDFRNFQKEKGINPMAQFSPMFASGMVLSTMFFALRGMANCPVESMKVGGMGWFIDLTICDPMYILPMLSCTTLFLNMKWGADAANAVDAPGVPKDLMVNVMRFMTYGMPIMMFPVMLQFPAALNLYWFTTNIISLFQGALLRNKAISRSMGIEELKVWKEEDLAIKNVTFMDQYEQILKQAEQERIQSEKNRQNFKLDDIIKTTEEKEKTNNKGL